MSSFNSNTRVRIGELPGKNDIEFDNLIIVEDKDDTKKATIEDLARVLIGDYTKPNYRQFYSTNKIEDIARELKRLISTKGDSKKLEELSRIISDIIVSNGDGNKDTELIAARNGLPTLKDRLEQDAETNSNKYIHNIRKTASGKIVNIPEHRGYVDISITRMPNMNDIISPNNIIIRSKNILDISRIEGQKCAVQEIAHVTEYHIIDINSDKSGYTFMEKQCANLRVVEIPLDQVYNAGKYTYFTSSIEKSDNFENLNIKLNIGYTDGTIESIPYDHSGSVEIDAAKAFNKISLDYSDGILIENSWISVNYIMLVPEAYVDEHLNTFCPYAKYTYDNVSIGDTKYNIYDSDYIFECNIQNAIINVTYYDNKITAEWICNKITELESILNNKIDSCGLITDYGKYLFLDNMYISSYEDGVHVSNSEDKYIRNGVYSKKISIASNAIKNTIFRIPFENTVSAIETIGVLFFVDKTVSSMFDSQTGGIKIRLCSDDITISSEVNYYEYLITKKEMIQGWNFVKRRLIDFISVGNPNPNSIQYIHFEICRTDEMGGCSVYLNSFVFNQKMKPSVLMCLNGIYDDSTTYLYPYMKTRGIKPTIFLNSKRSLEPETIDSILSYKYNDDWDIGLDGCHPNKEILTQDDNYRNQYMAIKNSFDWLNSNLTNSPISYSAAYGNLRPITANIIRDFGMKIVKTDSDGYCGFFSDKDLALPSVLINNEITSEDIIDKIDYAIETGQSIVLYTNDVTEYGSEIDAKKVIFESIIDYIHDRVELGKLDSLTFREFYNKCIN